MYFIAREGNQQQPAACRASIRTYECWFNPKQPQRLTVFIARWSHQICISVSANVRDTLSILNSKRRRGDKMTFSQLIHTHTGIGKIIQLMVVARLGATNLVSIFQQKRQQFLYFSTNSDF